MKKVVTLFLCLFFCLHLAAQNISVASFEALPEDLTANTAGTMVLDQNGEKCALIKVVTTEGGFSFDVGSLGVVNTDHHKDIAEYWVYVPAGVKKISIFHPQLGQLRDYDLGLSVQRAKTYLLKLTTGSVQTIVKQAVTSQFLLFHVTPENATVIVNNEVWPMSEGYARKYVPFGTYSYTIMAPDYHTATGSVKVSDPDNKVIVETSLKPNFAQITLKADNQAEIWVNGEKKGDGAWTGNLGGGEYQMETRLTGHRPSMTLESIKPESGPRTIKLPSPTPIYGQLMVSTLPDMSEVFVDGKSVGQTPLMLQNILIGAHKVTIKKSGYKDLSQEVEIEEGQTFTMEGSLEKGLTPPASGSCEYVDLGLPSGTLWATCNVGANKPEEYGDYFAWGETKPRASNRYSWKSYKWNKGWNENMTKYCIHKKYGNNGFTDGKMTLDPVDDAATANWGAEWKMPTEEQYEELTNERYTTTEWTTLNGVKGRKITSKKNGNSIFLPAAGYRNYGYLYGVGSHGFYWSSSLYSGYSYGAYDLNFYSGNVCPNDSSFRYFGQSVRPVR